jgi:hypothetical protein
VGDVFSRNFPIRAYMEKFYQNASPTVTRHHFPTSVTDLRQPNGHQKQANAKRMKEVR